MRGKKARMLRKIARYKAGTTTEYSAESTNRYEAKRQWRLNENEEMEAVTRYLGKFMITCVGPRAEYQALKKIYKRSK